MPDNWAKSPYINRQRVMTPQQLKAMTGGAVDDTAVVTCDHPQGITSARIWWAPTTTASATPWSSTGGWRRWVAEGHTVTFDRPRPANNVTFIPRADESSIATGDEVMAAGFLDGVVV